jgi:hypothetical protein
MRVVRAGSRRRRIHAASAHSTATYVDHIAPAPGYRRDPSQGHFPHRNPTQVVSSNRLALHGHHQDLISQTGQFGRRQAGFETGQARFETSSIAFASHLAAANEQLVPLHDSAHAPATRSPAHDSCSPINCHYIRGAAENKAFQNGSNTGVQLLNGSGPQKSRRWQRRPRGRCCQHRRYFKGMPPINGCNHSVVGVPKIGGQYSKFAGSQRI